MIVEDSVLDYISKEIDDFVYHKLGPDRIAAAVKRKGVNYNPDWCISESTPKLERAMDVLCDAIMDDLFYNK